MDLFRLGPKHLINTNDNAVHMLQFQVEYVNENFVFVFIFTFVLMILLFILLYIFRLSSNFSAGFGRGGTPMMVGSNGVSDISPLEEFF